MSIRFAFRTRRRPAAGESLFDRLIDPIDRLAETVFSILILLTFTLAFRIVRLSGDAEALEAGDTNDLLLGALGAIVAWGIIDGVMYALIALFGRGERHRLLRQIQSAASDAAALEVIADDLDYLLEPIIEADQRHRLYQGLLEPLRAGSPRRIGFTRDDLNGALGHLVIAVLAVLPSLAPLVLLRHDFNLALRVSNLVSLGMLFLAGYRWGRYTGTNPWKTGLLLMGVALAMVLIAIPLGG